MMQIILRAYKSAVKSFETPECLGSLSAVQNNYQQALVSLTQQKFSLCRERMFAWCSLVCKIPSPACACHDAV